ncbi:DUF3772 domain-containing protein [Pseudomonas sp. NA-150]|uniref:DUF3772 domain-containing protein n=1 Tax=Pseudomonas sp. NA-150 TaxID=3367525 RepID=UPI0037C723DD
MGSFSRIVVRALFIFLLNLSVGGHAASAATDGSASANAPSTAITVSDDLQKIQDRLDSLKQQTSVATDYGQWVVLKDFVQQLTNDANALTVLRVPVQTQLQAQLDVLGPVPTAGAAVETPAVAHQRSSLLSRKLQLDTELQQLVVIKESAAKLATQIAEIRRTQLESQLTLRSGSILNPGFWSPFFAAPVEDRQRLNAFASQMAIAMSAAWQPAQRTVGFALVVFALLLCTLGRRLAEKLLTRYCMHHLPEGRLRRSSLALATTLCTVLTVGCALELIFLIFTRQPQLAPTVQNFIDEFETLSLTCVLLAGLSRALLSTERPSWRLPAMADPVALAMKPYPGVFAVVLVICGTFLRMTNVIGLSLPSVIAGRGVMALSMMSIVGVAMLRTNQVRKAMAAAGNPPEARSTFAGLIHASVCLVVVIALFAVLIGYVSFATFLTYELVWFYIVVSSFYLLSLLSRDICESVFSPKHASGKAIKQLVSFGDLQLEQAAVVLSGTAKALLLLFASVALFVGGFGAHLGELVDNTVEILGGEGLRQLDIVPRHLLNAIMILAIGWYLIRSLRKWLDAELLPKTDMDPGMRTSLSTLFSNIGYTSVALLTFYALGVKWSNLAWIVSALSVGIGFGLQEIVKNFVSGLILLTERPVKVGDLVSIGGVEGDIRRINVRATEIQLSDRSIVIVPNSQLISQNLRNVTMGGSAQGVAMLEMTFAPNIDPEQVRTLLLNTYLEHKDILERPAPSVRFIQLTAEGVMLRVTGFVSSPRIVGNIKSELLFEILKQLSAAGISLTNPQT